MQRRGSIAYASSAPVGQAVRQRVQVPQWSAGSGTASSERSVRSAARKKYEPAERGGGRGAIRIGERHDAARPGKRRARVYALCRAPREVAHLARAAVREPALEKRPPLEGAERRRAGPREPEQTRLARDALRGGGHC